MYPASHSRVVTGSDRCDVPLEKRIPALGTSSPLAQIRHRPRMVKETFSSRDKRTEDVSSWEQRMSVRLGGGICRKRDVSFESGDRMPRCH